MGKRWTLIWNGFILVIGVLDLGTDWVYLLLEAYCGWGIVVLFILNLLNTTYYIQSVFPGACDFWQCRCEKRKFLNDVLSIDEKAKYRKLQVTYNLLLYEDTWILLVVLICELNCQRLCQLSVFFFTGVIVSFVVVTARLRYFWTHLQSKEYKFLFISGTQFKNHDKFMEATKFQSGWLAVCLTTLMAKSGCYDQITFRSDINLGNYYEFFTYFTIAFMVLLMALFIVLMMKAP